MLRILVLASTSLLACSIHAANQPLSLPAQVILGSGNDSQDLRLPLARHTVTRDQIHAPNAGANLSESLQRVPGLVALNRQNYAQDLQISSRGFGARSQFGVRGVRLRSEEHTSELQSRPHLVCRLLLEKKNKAPHPDKGMRPVRQSRLTT